MYHNKKKGVILPLLDGLVADIPNNAAVVPRHEYRSKCDCILGIIKMAKSFVSLNRDTIAVLIKSRFIDAIGRILMQITSKFFHFRLNRSLRALLFNEWRTEWLLAFEILTICSLSEMMTLDLRTFPDWVMRTEILRATF